MSSLEFLAHHGSKGVECGCISVDVFMKYIRYMHFLDYRKKGIGHTRAVELTADDNKCGMVTIYRDISFFQKGERDNA